MTEKRNIRPVRYDTLRIVSRAIMCEKAWYVEDKSNYHYALFCGEKCVCSLTEMLFEFTELTEIAQVQFLKTREITYESLED